MRSGRRERGLVAVSAFQNGQEQRVMIAMAYIAEHTGSGVSGAFTMEGAAPADIFRSNEGVVRRSGGGAAGR